jgi:pimeloyl-ACP methyl ester carboxylesterase
MKHSRSLTGPIFLFSSIALLAVPSRGTVSSDFVPTRFTVVDAGTVAKPDVILIPGLASSRAVWDAEAKLLAPNYRLHLVQIDGFAGTPAGPNAAGTILPGVVEELHSYIVANKMHPAIVGHSLGGLLALLLARKYPDDLRKLIIVDALPYYAVIFNPAATVETTKPQAEMMRQQVIAASEGDFAAMQPASAAMLVKSDDGRKAVAASAIASNRTVFANAMYEDLQTDLRGDIATIKTPTVVLYPYDATAEGPDPAMTDALYTSAYKKMPNAELVRIDDSRHFIMYDQPVKFDSALETFLK